MCLAFRIILISSITICTTATPRLIGGQPVDTLRRFPHHVTIETDVFSNGVHRLCGGSILSEQWVLTSALCVDGSERLYMHFKKLYYANYTDSFTVVVNKDEVHMHPTLYFDIALIHIPMNLVFSDAIKPVSISYMGEFNDQFAVMPGFEVKVKEITTTSTATISSTPAIGSSTTDWPTSSESTMSTSTPKTSAATASDWPSSSESTKSTSTPTNSASTATDWPTSSEPTMSTYTVTEAETTTASFSTSSTEIPAYRQESNKSFSIGLSRNKRQSIKESDQLVYGMFKILSSSKCKSSAPSEFDEFTQLCTENLADNNPCEDYGNGLLVGWPGEKTEIVGIYSFALNNCTSKNVAVYTKVSKFLPWIQSITNGYVK